MRILVSGSTRMVREVAGLYPDHVGHLLVPRNGYRSSVAGTGLPFAADNGCFQRLEADLFRKMLAWLKTVRPCLWIACPDVVGDARATLARFREWRDEVAEAGPVAFVGQDGASSALVPWDDFDAYFVGGSTPWKLSRASWRLVQEAKACGKQVHLGRVNSMRRLGLAYRWGCDSVDGSSYSKWGGKALCCRPDMLLERHLHFLLGLEGQEARQLKLFPGLDPQKTEDYNPLLCPECGS